MTRQTVAIRSPGIWKLRRDVAAVTGLEPQRYRLRPPEGSACLLGWGHRPSADPVRRAAAALGLPYLGLEDGFLRSVRPGPDVQVGYVLDRSGIYYDARQPSDLEGLLQEGGWEEEVPLARAREGMALLRRLRLSKYNDGADLSAEALELEEPRRPRVLVIDQTAGDASIPGALAEAGDFEAMLAAALAENPDAEILVKGHPEVALGRKRGHLAEPARAAGLRFLAERVNPWCLLERVDRVYTVSSGLGFEALCAGLPVTCFGLPFYAGWGATDDRRSCPRRSRRRSAEEIFAAAYLRYSRYLDPWDRRPIDFEEAAEALAFLRDIHFENRRPAVLVGFTRWKRKTVAAFLRGEGQPPRFARRPAGAVALARRHEARLLVWNTRCPAGLREAAAAAGMAAVNVEDGFLRSVGLGAALTPAASLVFDPLGIYYDPTRPSRLEEIAQQGGFTPELLARAAALREAVVRHAVTKYNVGRRDGEPLFPKDRPAVFVPGQVEDDESVRLGAPGVGGNLGLLQAVRARHPEAFILYKPHPDVEAGYRQGALEERRILEFADAVVRDIAIPDILAQCDAVETMTSLVGFEALLRGRRVTAHGLPFYAGWGLTEDLLPCPRRSRRLELDELVAAALILYPRYLDPVSGLPCPPELVVTRLAEGRGGRPRRRIILPLKELAWHLLAAGRRLRNRRLQAGR